MTARTDEEIGGDDEIHLERQVSRLYVVGSNDITAPVIEASIAAPSAP